MNFPVRRLAPGGPHLDQVAAELERADLLLQLQQDSGVCTLAEMRRQQGGLCPNAPFGHLGVCAQHLRKRAWDPRRVPRRWLHPAARGRLEPIAGLVGELGRIQVMAAGLARL